MTSHMTVVTETRKIGVKSVSRAALKASWQNRRAMTNAPVIDIIA
jgi:hypothetical protein